MTSNHQRSGVFRSNCWHGGRPMCPRWLEKRSRGFSTLSLVACTIDMTSLGSADNNAAITMANEVGKLALLLGGYVCSSTWILQLPEQLLMGSPWWRPWLNEPYALRSMTSIWLIWMARNSKLEPQLLCGWRWRWQTLWCELFWPLGTMNLSGFLDIIYHGKRWTELKKSSQSLASYYLYVEEYVIKYFENTLLIYLCFQYYILQISFLPNESHGLHHGEPMQLLMGSPWWRPCDSFGRNEICNI